MSSKELNNEDREYLKILIHKRSNRLLADYVLTMVFIFAMPVLIIFFVQDSFLNFSYPPESFEEYFQHTVPYFILGAIYLIYRTRRFILLKADLKSNKKLIKEGRIFAFQTYPISSYTFTIYESIHILIDKKIYKYKYLKNPNFQYDIQQEVLVNFTLKTREILSIRRNDYQIQNRLLKSVESQKKIERRYRNLWILYSPLLLFFLFPLVISYLLSSLNLSMVLFATGGTSLIPALLVFYFIKKSSLVVQIFLNEKGIKLGSKKAFDNKKLWFREFRFDEIDYSFEFESLGQNTRGYFLRLYLKQKGKEFSEILVIRKGHEWNSQKINTIINHLISKNVTRIESQVRQNN